jgi:rSAM/selenodomain-associated transferase 1
MPERLATLPAMRRALVIVAKAPAAGTTKTRLIPRLGPERAAELYRAFLLDAVNLGLQLTWERVCVIHPRGAGAALAAVLPAEILLLEQRASGLAEALALAFEHHFEAGFERVVLIGSDNPTLPLQPVEQACSALELCDLTIGPSADGGYYLLGMRQPHPPLFEDIEWSTERVYAQTLERARCLGLRVCAVDEWYDVDTPADLDRMEYDLQVSGDTVAPNTRAVLRALRSG